MAVLRSVAVVLFALALSSCMAPVTYPQGRSLSDVPKTYAPVKLESVVESTMMGNDDPTIVSGEEQLEVLNSVRAGITKAFAEKGVVLVTDGTDAPTVIRAKVYWLPYNPIIGGHINIFLKLYDKNDRHLMTGFLGTDFALLSLAALGGSSGLAEKMGQRATVRMLDELKKIDGTSTADAERDPPRMNEAAVR